MVANCFLNALWIMCLAGEFRLLLQKIKLKIVFPVSYVLLKNNIGIMTFKEF